MLKQMQCRRCQAFIKDASLLEEVEDYVASLSEEDRCDEATYERRLLTCEACPKQVNGMCGYCGCFVLIRAARVQQDCPAPGGSRWS